MRQATDAPGGAAVTQMCEHNMVLMSAAKRAVDLLERGGALAVAGAIELLQEAIEAIGKES